MFYSDQRRLNLKRINRSKNGSDSSSDEQEPENFETVNEDLSIENVPTVEQFKSIEKKPTGDQFESTEKNEKSGFSAEASDLDWNFDNNSDDSEYSSLSE